MKKKKIGFLSFKPVEPLLLPLFLFLYQINRYKNKCGGDLRAQLTNIFLSTPSVRAEFWVDGGMF